MIPNLSQLFKNCSENLIDFQDDDKTAIKISIREEWNKTIDVGAEDFGYSVVTDTLGYTYLTGKSFNASKNCYDVILMKYDQTGSLEWSKIWGGFSDDIGNGIALDTSNGVHIVGSTSSYGSNGTDLLIIKYNSSGDFQWNNTWGGMGWDVGYGIHIDTNDNIFICGYSETYDINGDIILLKYDFQGVLKWNRTWGTNNTELAYKISSDSHGNFYVTGYIDNEDISSTDLLFIKFNNSGYAEWNKTWGGLLQEEGRDIKVDYFNNSYIIGNTKSFGLGSYDVTLLKFNNSGGLEWNITWGGASHDFSFGIDINLENEIIITGTTKSFLDKDYGDFFLLKYNSSGYQIWNMTWGGTNLETGYDISVDLNNNIYVTGSNGSDIYLQKFAPFPRNFVLSSTADSPDHDGNFTLNWIHSLDTDNYSIYQYHKLITEYNDTMRIAEDLHNLSFNIKNQEEGDYYFIIVAINIYGNTSSNCIRIVVTYPPGGFTLTHTAEEFDGDGNFILNWSVSLRAQSYSIYQSDSYINEISPNCTLIKSGILNNYSAFTNINNSNNFYAVEAYNEAGNNISNCVQITVRRHPNPFTLEVQADNPDTDGRFYLIWNPSFHADNYTIFYYNQSISEVNESLWILEYGLEQSDNPLFIPEYFILEYHNWTSGTYYFIIRAYNLYNNYTSNVDILIIEILDNHDSNNGGTPPPFPIINILSIVLIIGLLSVLVTIRRMRKKKG